MDEVCEICEHKILTKGNSVYIQEWVEDGCMFKQILNIQFCPKCGKELPFGA